MERFADLHLHTAHSREADNFLPERLKSIAEAKNENPGLEIVGIVDHDTLNQVEPMYRAQRGFNEGTLPVILPGIEISSAFEFAGKQVQTHVLGYFPGLIEENRAELKKIDTIMRPVMERVIAGKLRKNMDIRIAYFVRNAIIPPDYDVASLKKKMLDKYKQDRDFVDEHEGKSGDTINWSLQSSDKAIVDILCEEGIISSTKEGKLYVDRKSPGKVEALAGIIAVKENLTLEIARKKAEKLQGSCHGSYGDDYDKITTQEAVALIKKASGVPILAHPMVSMSKFPGDSQSFFAFCRKDLLPCGLMGMEAFYPGQENLTQIIVDFCLGSGLFVTGGSDDHQDGRNHVAEQGSRCPLEYVKGIIF